MAAKIHQILCTLEAAFFSGNDAQPNERAGNLLPGQLRHPIVFDQLELFSAFLWQLELVACFPTKQQDPTSFGFELEQYGSALAARPLQRPLLNSRPLSWTPICCE
jgi:hypothetical protein